MSTASSRSWKFLCRKGDLDLRRTLSCGQLFSFRPTGDAQWTGPVGTRCFTLREDGSGAVLFRDDTGTGQSSDNNGSSDKNDGNVVLKRSEGERDGKDDRFFLSGPAGDIPSLDPGCVAVPEGPEEEALLDLLRLRHPHNAVDFAALHQRWAENCPYYQANASGIRGLRVLRQDPVECLFSFLASQNNNIKRIAGMLASLRKALGARIPIDHDAWDEYISPAFPDGVHAFPALDTLASTPEETYRLLGFGYRAKYIVGSAQAVVGLGGTEWLHSLRGGGGGNNTNTLAEAAGSSGPAPGSLGTPLTALPGVGRKVADCVALFSLDDHAAVPVDTHVRQIAERHYLKSLRNAKSITPTVYTAVGDAFRASLGPLAGWAHTSLFAADLPAFRQEAGGGKKDPAGGEKQLKGSSSEPSNNPLKRKKNEEKEVEGGKKKMEKGSARETDTAAGPQVTNVTGKDSSGGTKRRNRTGENAVNPGKWPRVKKRR